MRIILLTFLLLLLPFISRSQDWKLLTPYHSDADYTDIDFVGNDTYYLFDNYRDQILKSVDGGKNWKLIKEVPDFMTDAHMFDENNGLISIGHNIFSTNDGFETLIQETSELTSTRKFFFLDDLTGFSIGEENRFFTTNDGGKTWVNKSFPTSYGLRNVFFLNSDIGYICTQGTVFKTVDGGDNWAPFLEETSYDFLDIYFFDELNGVVIGNEIKYTSDGGATWHVGNDDGGGGIIKKYGDKLIILKRNGDLLTSLDKGVTWSKVSIGTGYPYLYDFEVTNSQIIVVGEGKIYQSRDGGNSFTLSHEGIFPGELKGISFADELRGAVTGDNTLITSDGGISWRRTHYNDYNAIYLTEDGNGIVCGDNGNNAITYDYGNTWQPRASVGPIASLTCWMESPTNYIIAGGNGISAYSGLYHTENSGVDWQYSDLGKIADVYFPTQDVGYAVHGYGSVYKTEDGGDTWDQIGTVGYNNKLIYFFSSEIGYSSTTGGVRKTIDGGSTWTGLPDIGGVIALRFFDEMTGYGVSTQGYVYQTADGGASWTYLIGYSAQRYDIVDATILNGRVVAVGGDDIYEVDIPPYFAKAYPVDDFVTCEEEHNSGIATFDLGGLEEDIANGQTDVEVSFYLNQEDADAGVNPIIDIASYENTQNPQNLVARIEKLDSSSYDTTPFNLVVNGIPDASAEITSYEVFDGNVDGFAEFDLTTKLDEILNGQDGALMAVSFYTSQADAENRTDPIPVPSSFINSSNPQTIHIGILNVQTGCYVGGTQAFTISEKAVEPLSATVNILSPISCNSANDASLQVMVSGGEPPYMYTLLDGESNIIVGAQAGNVFSGLSSGNYIAEVIDNLGEVTYGNSVSFIEPSAIEAEIASTDVSCKGINDGLIQIILVIGGAPPYQCRINGGEYRTSNIFENLPSNTYFIEVMDSNGCVFANQVILESPDDLDMDNDGIGDSCDEDVDGDGILNVDDNCPEMANPGQEDTDNDGIGDICDNDNEPLHSEALVVSPITCPGARDGVVQIGATGGSQPYLYELLDNNYNTLVEAQTSNVLANLGPGNYITKVIDNIGEESIFSIVLEEPEPLEITGTIKEITCNGANDGLIEIAVTGGTAPYNYRVNGGGYQTTNLFDNLAPGQYTVEVSDVNNCIATSIVEITEPEALMVTATTTGISCKGLNDGGITIQASGGTSPFTFSLDGATFQQDNEFFDLSPGFYTALVKDGNNCLVSVEVGMSEPDSPDFDNDGIGDACDDDDMDGDGIPNNIDECPETPLGTQVDASGCTGFTLPSTNFTLQTTGETCATSNNGSILITAVENLDYQVTLRYGESTENKFFRTFASFQDLEAGAYEVCIVVIGEPDFERCFSVQINEPEPLNVESKIDASGKSITLKMSGGSNYTITLNDQEYLTASSEITLPLPLKENRVMVSTDKDCQGVYENLITVDTSDIYVYPNPVDNGSVSIMVPGAVGENVRLSLYANDGKMVLQKNTTNTGNPIELNVSGFTSGIYSLRLEVGNEEDARRIIIK